jgi:hypothetical protein
VRTHSYNAAKIRAVGSENLPDIATATREAVDHVRGFASTSAEAWRGPGAAAGTWQTLCGAFEEVLQLSATRVDRCGEALVKVGQELENGEAENSERLNRILRLLAE